MNFKDFDLKTWFFPTICFLLFCYGMAFIVIYTYTSNADVSLFNNNKTPSGVTDVNKFKEEMLKQIKKIN
ncbi:hypothetical protein [Helicobacter sp. 13S00477-4]|uniref:hypothetical protein n=1 Tax=Helicobacter sp. 13S00477-4 TaxID=1905759 RepID=UPI000BA6A66E|nr:hypothetical protein [Helicobacter sp. 13S00477-4]PAF52809.1 hypothetical protein BKH44_01095 [Helicobacter sp. 13S00477-4]